jgi:hypothetical protein
MKWAFLLCVMVLIAVGLYFQFGWWYAIILGIIILGIILGIIIWGLVALKELEIYEVPKAIYGRYYDRYHDFDTYRYYQPFDKKFAFSHLLTKLDEAIFGSIGILETNIDFETELNHRKNSTNAYRGNLQSFNLENDEQVINFFYSYGRLRITWTYNQDPIITNIMKYINIIKYFKIEDIENIGIQEQEEIAKQMINLISENKSSIDDYLKKNGMLIQNKKDNNQNDKYVDNDYLKKNGMLIQNKNERTKNMAVIKELALEIIRSINASDVIYAEYAVPGAMGNCGGVIIYVLDNEILVCYQTNFYTDEFSYYSAIEFFENNSALFKAYYGGCGNHVFVNAKIILEVEDEDFIYKTPKQKYEIRSSVFGVFDSVRDQLFGDQGSIS